MSVLRPRPPADPVILIDPADVAPTDRASVGPPMTGAALAPIRDQPARLLADYRMERPASELYCLLQLARRIRDRSDRVIVVSAGGEAAAARTILDTCCHPFHADLPRAERGGRPRLFFTGASFANDREQGLLDLVAPAGRPPGGDLMDRWALVVVAGDPIPPSVAACARLYLDVLGREAGAAIDRLALVGTPLAPLAAALGLATPCAVPAGCAGAWGVFTAGALLPAAIAGVDVVRLLEGAVAMNMRCDEAPFADNPARRLIASAPPGMAAAPRRRRLVTTDERLAAVAAWFDHLHGAIPAAGALGPAICLTVDEPRRDPLVVPPPAAWLPDGDGLPLDDVVGAGWSELERRARAPGGVPELRLPRVDEHALGQLLQMLLLTTRVLAVPAAGAPSGPAGAGLDEPV
jgi:hypothetical protein